jgi:hypothetical protein
MVRVMFDGRESVEGRENEKSRKISFFDSMPVVWPPMQLVKFTYEDCEVYLCRL